MNEVLAPAWSEQVVRLQLGVEPADALGSPGSPLGVAVHSEDVPRPHPVPSGWTAGRDASAGLPALRRGPSGRFALPFRVRAPVSGGPPPTQVVLRLVDPRRGFVPRRLGVPVPTLSQVLAAEAARDRDPSVALVARACRPVMFPGAAYGVPAGATLLRGRITRKVDGAPVPWARVEATVAGPQQLEAWWAHGDEQGEFVLVVGTLSDVLAKLASRTVDLAITVHSRPVPADGTPVDSPTGTRADPLWHLPVETLGSLDPGDAVARGVAVPSGYTSSPVQTVTCRRGGTTGLVHLVLT